METPRDLKVNVNKNPEKCNDGLNARRSGAYVNDDAVKCKRGGLLEMGKRDKLKCEWDE